MEANFESKTQYDNSYNNIWEMYPDAKKGLACPYFALATAYNFMKNGNITSDVHEINIFAGIQYFAMVGSNTEMNFKELLAFSDLKSDDIMCTTSMLVQSGEIGFPEMIQKDKPLDESKYCTIILKNSKFFVIMIDKNGYYIRDCHESFQYNYKTFEDIVSDINQKYQFSETINITGISYDDYSSIEFLKIDKKFKTHILEMLGLDDIVSNTLYKIESPDNGIVGKIDLDDSIEKYKHKNDDDASIFKKDDDEITNKDIKNDKKDISTTYNNLNDTEISYDDLIIF